MPIGGYLQDGRAAEAAVGDEELLAEVLLTGGGDGLRRDAREVAPAVSVFGAEGERNEGGARVNDVEAELVGEVVAEAGCSHTGNRESAGGDDERGGACGIRLRYLLATVGSRYLRLEAVNDVRCWRKDCAGFRAFRAGSIVNDLPAPLRSQKSWPSVFS